MIVKTKTSTSPQYMNEGDAKGVALREMITRENGAPNFSLRVFDLDAMGNTPYHSHPH